MVSRTQLSGSLLDQSWERNTLKTDNISFQVIQDLFKPVFERAPSAQCSLAFLKYVAEDLEPTDNIEAECEFHSKVVKCQKFILLFHRMILQYSRSIFACWPCHRARQCCLQQPNNKKLCFGRDALTHMGRLRRSRTHHARRDVHRGARTRVCEQISSSKCYQYRCIGSDARLGSDSAYRP